MAWKKLLVLGVALAFCGAQSTSNYAKNGLVWGCGTRMNQIQMVGTHNSYHMEVLEEERELIDMIDPWAKNLDYSHDLLDVQLNEQHVRSIELDIYADPKGGHYANPDLRNFTGREAFTDPAYYVPGAKVLHIPDLDYHTRCVSLVSCLSIVKAWLDSHPAAVPIPILLDLKQSVSRAVDFGGVKAISWNNRTLLDSLDAEIRSIFPPEKLITPDDIRRQNHTLEQSVLQHGWPTLDSARGRAFFLMANDLDDKLSTTYVQGRLSLQGRVMFTNSKPGQYDCAFQRLSDPLHKDDLINIQSQVKANYYVLTRADASLSTVQRCSTRRRDAAFKSGAHIVSTDFPFVGMSDRHKGCRYVVEIGGGKVARCNPVNAEQNCMDQALE